MNKRSIIIVSVIMLFAILFAIGCANRCANCGKTIKVTVLDGVNFDFAKYAIKPFGIILLDKDIEMLKKDNGLIISIEGHCDIIGSDDYNQKLSEKRARVVYDYFLSKGIDASRMTAIGFGRKKPLVANDTEEDRAKNRRVEIHIIKKK